MEAPGALQVTGMAAAGAAVCLDGEPVAWQNSRGSFLVEGVSVAIPAPPAIAIVTSGPVLPPPIAGPIPMTDAALGALAASVAAESFSSNKLDVIRAAASSNWFTIAQVGRPLDCVTMSSDKVEAARILAPRTVDRANAWQLNSHLTFSSDKRDIAAIFK